MKPFEYQCGRCNFCEDVLIDVSEEMSDTEALRAWGMHRRAGLAMAFRKCPQFRKRDLVQIAARVGLRVVILHVALAVVQFALILAGHTIRGVLDVWRAGWGAVAIVDLAMIAMIVLGTANEGTSIEIRRR